MDDSPWRAGTNHEDTQIKGVALSDLRIQAAAGNVSVFNHDVSHCPSL